MGDGRRRRTNMANSSRNERIISRVRAIPKGFVRTYGDVDPLAPRLVGRILSQTHDLPWHRVVRADGTLPQGEAQRKLLVGVATAEWPRKHGDVEEKRETSGDSAGLGVQEIVDHYAELIGELAQPPVLVGHSYGGLFVELLLDRGLGRAGVAMSPAPPKGILKLPFSTLKAGSPALAHPSKWHGVVPLTLEEFTYGFVNTFSAEEAKAAYERYAVPETGQIFFEAGFANFRLHPPTEVHFKNAERAPLLIVGAGEDHTVPASLAKAAYKRYEDSPAQ